MNELIKRMKCKTCGDDRDMLVSGGHFVCTSCGTSYDLKYIATSFYTPLMIEISFMINDLDELGGDPIDISEEEMEAPEFEISDSDELHSEDAELADEEFLAAEEISPIEKAKFCLLGYFYRAAAENDPRSAGAFLDTVLLYDKTNFAACLIRAVEDTWSIPQYTISRTGDVPWDSLDTLPVSFGEETDVKFSQKLFDRISDNELAKHLQTVLSLLLASVRNAPSGELCTNAYHIASTVLDLYGVFLQLNTLGNLKELPTNERYGEYIEHELAMAECQNRLKKAAAARLTEWDVSDVDLDAACPHFHDFFPDIPNWACHLAETEYRTAEEIWEKAVVSNVDLQTGQVSAPHQLQELEGILVTCLLLDRHTNAAAEEVDAAELHALQIAQKKVKKLLDVIRAAESFSFGIPKIKDFVASLGNAEELEEKLSFIDEELSGRL